MFQILKWFKEWRFNMSRRTTGVLLLVIASLLYSTRYVAAAIYSSGMSGWGKELFNTMLQYVGPGLPIWSSIAFAAGLLYLVWAEIDAIRTQRSNST
jgi:hypothetical protein